ncbi:MAG: endolytic transglycosylase MltG [Candidatus Sungbacteria bacterium]|nr:endolytic transglycosylase MltG [Candidatus Sungbacteria bacterium]
MPIISHKKLAVSLSLLLLIALFFVLYQKGLFRLPSRGTKKTELSLTIPEGWNTTEIAAYLDQQQITPKTDFNALAGQDATTTLVQKFSFLKEKPGHTGLEGYLFPDTYRFYTSTPAAQVAVRMLQNFDAKFSDELRKETERQHHTIFEIITMASLIEKEAATDADRELVSGILWKRLDLGIPLQVDATIIFVTGHRTARVSYADTSIDSPYNTYRYKGLPRGPIANPGISAISAALYPKKSFYLYYLSTPDGDTIFSKTLEEHNRAKAKYLK